MASITEFVKVYKETEGPTILFGFSKRKNMWFGYDSNRKLRWEAENEFKLFDLIIEHIKKIRSENYKKYKG